MPKKTDITQEIAPSLVPLLEAEEKHLEQLMETARAEAAGIVEEARQEASRRVKAAAEDPASHQEPLEVSGSTLSGGQASPSAGVRRIEEQARANLEKAVTFILSKVWPGDEP